MLGMILFLAFTAFVFFVGAPLIVVGAEDTRKAYSEGFFSYVIGLNTKWIDNRARHRRIMGKCKH